MAEKFSVLIKYKYLEYFENANLSSADSWVLMKAIIEYDRDGGIPAFENPVLTALFAIIKADIDSNREKWEETVEKKSHAGKHGGAPKGNQNACKNKQKQTKQPYDCFDSKKQTKQTKQTKQADYDYDYDLENVNENGFSDSSKRIHALSLIWNDLKIGPPFRKTVVNLSPLESSDLLRALQIYSDDNVSIGAMRNYKKVIEDSAKYDPGGCVYKSFIGFMTKGVEKFCDDAKPFDLFRKKGAGPPPSMKEKTSIKEFKTWN